jgi:uncharacterized protein YwgA
MDESIFIGAGIIAHLIKKMGERYPNKQIGKTMVQKMLYLLTREITIDFDYSMYYYGPYSGQVVSELDFAKDIGAVEIDWIKDRGYLIKPKEVSYEKYLTDEIRNKIDAIISKYGKFNAVELSIITTALYVKDNFGVKDDKKLMQVVASLKPQYKKNLNEILKEVNIIQ